MVLLPLAQLISIYRGTLLSRGLTTAQPVVKATVTPSGQTTTHITGAAGEGNATLEAQIALSTISVRFIYLVW